MLWLRHCTQRSLGKNSQVLPTKRNKQYLKSLLIPHYRKTLYNEQNPSSTPATEKWLILMNVLNQWEKYSSSKILKCRNRLMASFVTAHLQVSALCYSCILLPYVHSLSASQHVLKPCSVPGPGLGSLGMNGRPRSYLGPPPSHVGRPTQSMCNMFWSVTDEGQGDQEKDHWIIQRNPERFTEEIEVKRSLTGWVRHLQKGTGSRQVTREMSLEFGLNVNNRQKV